MRSFLTYRKLSFLEIALLPEVFFFLLIFRLKVSYQPSRKWMPHVALKSIKIIDDRSKEKAILIAKVVNGLARRTPWKSTCLVKALAANKMLHKRKIDHKIHFGVASTLNNQFEAHSWVSVEDEVLIGGGNLEGFHEISSFS